MPDDRSKECRLIWDRTHQETVASERPDDGLVDFAGRLRRHLSPGISVLDAGCGRGRNAAYLAESGFAVTGCDVSISALEKARARAAAGFQVGSLLSLPYADRRFDAAVCVHVLPYRSRVDLFRSVRELWRVLRPGGWLYFDLLDRDDADYGCGPQLEAHTFLDPDGIPVHFSARQEVDDLLRGFAPEQVNRLELKSAADRVRRVWNVSAVKSSGSSHAPPADTPS